MSGTRTLLHFLSLLILLLWSAVLLYFYVSGKLVHYLPPHGLFRPLVLASGIGLGIVALFNLFTAHSEEAGCQQDHDCGHDHSHEHEAHAHCHHETQTGCCGHDHHHDEPAAAHGHHENPQPHQHGILYESGWVGRLVACGLLILPLSLAAFQTRHEYSMQAILNMGVQQPSLAGAQATERGKRKPKRPMPKPTPLPAPGHAPVPERLRKQGALLDSAVEPPERALDYGEMTEEIFTTSVPKNRAGYHEVDLDKIFLSAGDIHLSRVMEGKPIETTAQVLAEKVNNPLGHRLRIFRLVVTCCAADARPYAIPIDFGKTAPEIKNMTWLRVRGTLNYLREDNHIVPILKVKEIEETTAPGNAMVY
jgi:Domain of unknown function (DUF1980)